MPEPKVTVNIRFDPNAPAWQKKAGEELAEMIIQRIRAREAKK